MNPEIPGYYFDPEKKKYFKIQKSHAAPTDAAYSSDAVKRRRVNDRTVLAAKKRAHAVRNHIRRHPMNQDAMFGGILAREFGLARVAECGRGRVEDGDVAAMAWAHGAVDKGSVPFAPSFARGQCPNMPCLYVNGEDTKTGLGMAYATLDEETLVASYIPTDQNETVSFSRDAALRFGRTLCFRSEMIRCSQVSSIKYHSPSHKMLVTSREPGEGCGLTFFSPPLTQAADPTRPSWLLGETDHYQRITMRQGQGVHWVVNGSTPAPASSDLICVIGTNRGVLKVQSNETMSLMAQSNPLRRLQQPKEIFAQDFQDGNHNILLAGGRQPRLWMSDVRAPESQWSFSKHASSISHIRSVNPNQVLVAGLQNSMALYDIRFLHCRRDGARPLLEFPDYCNEAHLQIGWDVDTRLGVVAAAQDNGTVRLFSLRSGRRLRSPATDALRSDSPFKALMFQTMPRERLPSLFVGDGSCVRKFSFGTTDLEEEA
ncbi:hypothetical protein B0J13DRAFT_100462 [Dactylonectria estremocensis]|uniref:Myocyte-specific enhancer factor 2d n=1 Tax=Dactylonectria estremocensis TaxID=1079267 RepID=A0A9P9EA50_9HYPO|nr:hypothetical protein B0J13DRAFT_100462 [Dactylonectria estremocensis]